MEWWKLQLFQIPILYLNSYLALFHLFERKRLLFHISSYLYQLNPSETSNAQRSNNS